MSKFNIILIYVKKYIFWVISLVCLLATMIVGNIVAGSRESYFQTRVSAIEGRFSEMQRLAGQDTPNEIVVTQKKEDVRNLKEKILDSWTRLYIPQRDLLVERWPEFRSEKDPEAFDQNAQAFQEQLRDAWERQTLYEQQNLLSTDVANAYRDYVMRSQARDFMKRYEIKVPKLTVDGGVAGNMGAMNVVVSDTLKAAGNAESELPTEGKMVWDERNRQQMLRRFSILARNTGGSRPNSTRKIFMVQEDIWAYDIILDAIAKMNARCEGDHDAVVKRIKAIDIADDASTLNTSLEGGKGAQRTSIKSNSDKDVVEFVNSSNRVVDVAEQKLSGDEELDMTSMNAGGMEEEEVEASPDPEFDILFDNRYCDKYGNFMAAAKFRTFLAGKPEYKMLPIHVQVVINQEQISRLMLNCMNAAMPIYIHQVSVKAQDLDSIPHTLEIIPEEKTTSEDGGVAGASSPKLSRYGNETRGAGVKSAMGMETTGVNALYGGVKTEQKPEDVEFEFWGMICMFNKPDEAKFNEALNGESDGSSSDEGADDEESEDEESADEGAADEESEDEESADEGADDEESEDEESADEKSDDVESDDVESDDESEAVENKISEDGESADGGANDGETDDSAPVAQESDGSEEETADASEESAANTVEEAVEEAAEESAEAEAEAETKAEKKSSKSSKKSSKG